MIRIFCNLLIVLFLLSCKKDDLAKKSPIITIPDVLGIDSTKITNQYDVIIYGATAAGIIAAVEIARSNKTVLLISPDGTAFGGMTSNGLGVTDYSDPKILGGINREFYQRVRAYYSNSSSWFSGSSNHYWGYVYGGDIMVNFEPKVAHSILSSFILEEKIPIIYRERLNRETGVKKNSNNKITSIEMESGKEYFAKIFMDATYEGDLMATAGVSYIVGRESNYTYNERNNGIQKGATYGRNQFPDGISGEGLKETAAYKLNAVGSNGSGDMKTQAYCFRMTLTNVKENRVPVPKPDNYNEDDYELLFRYLKHYSGNVFFSLDKMPNGKTDSNNSGPISINYVGMNYNYPDGTYEERDKIVQAHKDYQVGLIYTLQNSEKVPKEIRDYYSEWGLPIDEYTDNGNWPKQLYIREARRMIGSYVMTEHECLRKRIVEKPIALGSYSMDSHIVQRYIDAKGNVKNEGHAYLPVDKPYGIDYGAILPQEKECKNLLVPVCLSASHIAHGSIRMEPVFMQLAQSGACAAIISLNTNVSLHHIDYNLLSSVMDRKNIFYKID